MNVGSPPCNVGLQKTMAPEDARSMPISDFGRTAIAVAAKLGIVSDAPIVLAEGMSTVVHLRPSPIVGRVTRLTHLVSAREWHAHSCARAGPVSDGVAGRSGL